MKKSVLIVLSLLWISGLAFAGLEWKVKMVTQGESKSQANTVVYAAFAQDGMVKQVFESVENENEMFRAGSYWLFNSKENLMFLVNPKEKSYSEMNLSAIFQLAGIAGKLVKIKISNPAVKMEKLEAAEVAGYPCTHYKLVMDYDTEVKVVLIKTKAHQHVEREVWSSPKINAMEVASGFRHRDFKTGMEEMDNLIDIQLKAEGEIGFPLKMVSVTTTTDKKGREKETMRLTQEVLSIATKSIPASFFEIPSDYQKQKGGFLGIGE